MKYGRSPKELPRAQAIFFRISLISSSNKHYPTSNNYLWLALSAYSVYADTFLWPPLNRMGVVLYLLILLKSLTSHRRPAGLIEVGLNQSCLVFHSLQKDLIQFNCTSVHKNKEYQFKVFGIQFSSLFTLVDKKLHFSQFYWLFSCLFQGPGSVLENNSGSSGDIERVKLKKALLGMG